MEARELVGMPRAPAWRRVAGTGLAHSRVYAMVHGAMFDAVNALERRYGAYAGDLEAVPGASPDAAATVAAHTVLVELYPAQQAMLDAARGAGLARIPDGRARTDGVALGTSAARNMLTRRRNDGMSAKVPYVPRTGAGMFQLPARGAPIGPHWGAVTPFTPAATIRSTTRLRLSTSISPPPRKGVGKTE